MPEGYYCRKCKKFVLVARYMFTHPHEGQKTCLVCNRCTTMVYLREQGEDNAQVYD